MKIVVVYIAARGHVLVMPVSNNHPFLTDVTKSKVSVLIYVVCVH